MILYFGGNVDRHGPVDRLEALPEKKRIGNGGCAENLIKMCDGCRTHIAATCRTCPECGFEFPAPPPKHETSASTAPVLSGEISLDTYTVEYISYSIHRKRGSGDDAPRSLRVDYFVPTKQGFQSEWICFEHDGFARRNAVKWWKARSQEPVPDTAQAAYDIASTGGVAEPSEITIRSVSGEHFDRITAYKLGEVPEPIGAIEAREGIASNNDGEPGSVSSPDGGWNDSFDDIPF